MKIKSGIFPGKVIIVEPGKLSFPRPQDMKLAGYGRQKRYENIASSYIDVAPAIAHNKIMLIDRETVKWQLKYHSGLLKGKVIDLFHSC